MGFRVAMGGEAAEVSGSAAADLAARNAQFDDGSPGALLFNENCEDCHQQRANFRGIYGKDQASVEEVIRNGGNNVMSMPTFAEVLTAEETATLASYVREANGWD